MALPIVPIIFGLTSLASGATAYWSNEARKRKEKNKNKAGSTSGGYSSGGGTRGTVNAAGGTLAKPNLSDALKDLSSSGGGSYGGGVANRIDMTPYINSLREGAAANKKTISDSYAAQRNQLSQALKAYQENTATARRQAMDAYNSARADLEEDAYMNMRAAQQSAASRGLGGSGLQQLAQLSSQIESGEQTSDLSKQNTETQNELTKALKDYENQVNTSINDLTTEERNKITEIDANVATAIAEAQYNEEVRYQQALAEAAARNAAIASQRDSSLQDLLTNLNNYEGSLDGLTKDGIEALMSTFQNSDWYKNKNYSKDSGNSLSKDLSAVYSTYTSALNDAYANSGLGLGGRDYLDYYNKQLQNVYKVFSSNLNRK